MDADTVNRLRQNLGRVPTAGQSQSEKSKVVDPMLLSSLREDEIAKSDWLYDPMMGARAVLDGFFWGFSDEVAASVAAGSYQMLKGFLGPEGEAAKIPDRFKDREGYVPTESDEQSYLELRREMISGLEDERNEWTEENLGKTIGLNILGGFGSGGTIYNLARTGINQATQLGGRALAQVPALQRGVQAGQQAKVQQSLARAEAGTASVPRSVSATQAARQPVAQTQITAANAPTTMSGKLLQTAKTEGPALMLTGGLAGYGFADQDADPVDAFFKGAMFSFGLGVPFSVATNAALNGSTRNKIAQQLGKGRDFIPIGYATLKDAQSKWERGLNILYNQVVSKTFASNSLMAQQQKRFSTLADKELAKTENVLQQTTDDVNAAIQDAKNKLTFRAEQAKLDKTQREKLTAAEKKELDQQTIDNIKFNATATADEAQNVAEAAFRVQALKNAIPTGAPKGTAERLAGIENMHLRVKELNDVWRQHGYGMLKNRKFQINSSVLSAQVQAKLGKVPELVSALTGSGKVSNAAQLVDDFIATHVGKGGWIDGKDLNLLRTRIAQTANDLSDEGSTAATKQILRQIVETLDDTVLKQLPPKQQQAFREQQEQWLTNLVFRDAVQSATKKTGNFTMEGWLGASTKINRYRAGEGRMPLQGEANKLIATGKQRDEQIQALANQTIKREKAQNVKEAQANIRKVEQENLKISQELKVAKQKKDQEGQRRLEKELAEGRRRLASIKETLKAWGKAEASPDTPMWQQALGTRLLGAGSYLLGTLSTSLGFAREGFQRALVGQSGIQRAIQQGLQREDNFVAQAARVGAIGREALEAAPADVIESANQLSQLPDAGKVKAYMSLRSAGRLDELRTKNPKVWRELTDAYARTQQQQ